MKRCEAKVVKRRLELIRDLLDLAKEKEDESLALSDYYFRMCQPKGIPIEAKPPTTSPADLSSRCNEIFAEQTEAERKAREYRSEARLASSFIDRLPEESRMLLAAVYIDGRRYKDVAVAFKISPDAVRMRIDRAIMDAPSEMARACGLI